MAIEPNRLPVSSSTRTWIIERGVLEPAFTTWPVTVASFCMVKLRATGVVPTPSCMTSLGSYAVR